MLLKIGCQSCVIGASEIRSSIPGERFIEMHMGIDQPRQGHLLRTRIGRRQQAGLLEMPHLPAEFHSDQSIGHDDWIVTLRPVKQAPRDPGLE